MFQLNKHRINMLLEGKISHQLTFLDMAVQGNQENHIPKLQVSPLLYEVPVNKDQQLNLNNQLRKRAYQLIGPIQHNYWLIHWLNKLLLKIFKDDKKTRV